MHVSTHVGGRLATRNNVVINTGELESLIHPTCKGTHSRTTLPSHPQPPPRMLETTGFLGTSTVS